jgi:hypothetical protein
MGTHGKTNEHKWRFKQREYKKFPFCPRCGVKMVLLRTDSPFLPDNMVTLEHCFTKNPHEVKKRRRAYLEREDDGLKRWMILCRKCNHERGEEEANKVPFFKRWIIHRHFPWWMDWLNKLMKKFTSYWFTQEEVDQKKHERWQKKQENFKAMQEYEKNFLKIKEV